MACFKLANALFSVYENMETAKMTPHEAASRAAEIVGSKAKLAKLLAVAAPTVNQWCSGVRPIPAARAIQIEGLTSRLVRREELCPAFPWGEAAA